MLDSISQKVSIIIVNWNAGNQLTTCVRSIQEYGSDSVREIVVVDNGSTDGSAQTVKTLPNVRLIEAGKNMGFARACNLGARDCNTEYLLFLNPDTQLFPHCLSMPVEFMQRRESQNVGIMGIQLVDENGKVARSCSRFPHPCCLVAHAIGLNRLFPSLGHFMSEWDHSQTRVVDQVIGAFFLVKRNLFVQLGGFDERFFVYFEEVDFSFRAKQSGWISVYFADAQAYHAGGGTSRQVKATRLFYSLRSRLLYSFKHFPRWQAWCLVAVTCVLEMFTRVANSLLQRDWLGLKHTLLGYRMLWRALPLILRGEGRTDP